jgi:hypothetical protein
VFLNLAAPCSAQVPRQAPFRRLSPVKSAEPVFFPDPAAVPAAPRPGRVSIFDKFLPDDAQSPLSCVASRDVARVIATDVNRQFGLTVQAP